MFLYDRSQAYNKYLKQMEYYCRQGLFTHLHDGGTVQWELSHNINWQPSMPAQVRQIC